MTGDLLLRASGVGKVYPSQGGRMARLMSLALRTVPEDGFWALRDADLSLRRGEALGIVGRNGAGKSTLLQILCGIQQPTTGRIERFGRVAAMLQLGAGFKPDFTGRENVFFCAAVYGLSRREVADRFDRIAAFADIGAFIDRPVREYSSGMFARLAFAVCAHVDADLLVIDEVLSVGDASFQGRCRKFLEGYLERGAVVFVSHDDAAVLSICDRALWLEAGRPRASGSPEAVLSEYRAALTADLSAATLPGEMACSPEPHPASTAPAPRRDGRYGRNPLAVSSFFADAPAHGHGGARIEDAYFADREGRRLGVLQGSDTAVLTIVGSAFQPVERPIVGFILRDAAGQNLFGDNSYLRYRDRPLRLSPGERFRAELTFQMPYLPTGSYSIAPSIIDGTQEDHIQLHWVEEALVLTVRQSPIAFGRVGVPITGSAVLRPPTDAREIGERQTADAES